MEERLKHRLVGAAVLASFAVVIVPILLDEPRDVNEDISSTSFSGIPERPQDRFETTVTALELPETPRLDAEVERERSRRASDTSAGGRRVESDAPARVSVAASAQAPAAPRVPVSGTSPSAPSASAVAESPAPAAVPPSGSSGNGRTTEAPAAAADKWTVQLGSFLKVENASALRKRLRDSGYPAFVETGPSARGEVSRVLVGPMPDRGEAKDSAAKLRREMKLEGIVVPYRGG